MPDKIKNIVILLLLIFLHGCSIKAPVIALSDYKGVLSLPDGSTYHGKLKDGLLHGDGELTWKSGEQYKGEFHEGMMQGKGVYVYSNGTTYSGDFYKGLHHGQGLVVTNDGDRRKGQFVNGDMHGLGETTFSSGASYKGEYKNSQFDGQGVYIDSQGDRYVGQFKKNAAEGQIEIFYASGSYYKGEVKDWYFHGQGELINKAGDKYIATFVDGAATGHAEVIYETGNSYIGELKNGKLHGKGVYRTAKGRVYQGDFVEDVLSGQAEIDIGDGYYYKGAVVDWKADGYGVITMPERGVYKGYFKQNRFHGNGRMEYDDGNVYEGEFKDNLMHGQGVLTLKDPKGRKKITKGWWQEDYYYGSEKPPEENEVNSVAAKKDKEEQDKAIKIDAEKVLYSQYKILNNKLNALNPSLPDKSELFFISFGAYGAQDLFMKEARFSKDLFDQHFQTSGHSISLVNNVKTVNELPLATVTNLELSLKKMSELMGEEDILFLFLTSHGSKKHKLSVSLQDAPLNDLPAEELARLIDKSQVKWKVIIVSSCYSGGFIDALKDENTLVLTASSSDHVSFGCSDEAEFTYFGQAFFKNAVAQSTSFKQAFDKAVMEVAKREEQEGYSHSKPQIYIGFNINQHLKKWRKQL